MNRRTFFRRTSLASLAIVSSGGRSEALGRTEGFSDGQIGSVGGMSLSMIRDTYRHDLLERFVPGMRESVVDHEYGGFFSRVDIRTGERISTEKSAAVTGRGIWMYSCLYNEIEQREEYLEIARKSKELILALRPSRGFWPGSFTREGELRSTDGNIYGDLFIAEGLAEYAQASGDQEAFEMAREIIQNCMKAYDDPSYHFQVYYLQPDTSVLPGSRILGHWMVLLITATRILSHREDPYIEKVADRCLDAIMKYHMNRDYGLLNEVLAHDLTLPDNEFSQFAYVGHGIETLWMVMMEAVRRRDVPLFLAASKAFKRHVTVAADPVYGGYFRSLDHVDQHVWKVEKVLWLQEEVLIGAMLMIEHTNDPWAKEIFARTDAYIRKHYVRPGYTFWTLGGDRKLKEFNASSVGNYHHPRHLMFNLMALERILDRNETVSGLIPGPV